MAGKRKICIISGTRADYGILTPVVKAIINSNQLQAEFIVTGTHLLKEYGSTYQEIENDGFKIIKIDIAFKGNDGGQMAKTIGMAIIRLSDAFLKLKPDLVLVIGDRGEMLAAAIAANYLNIPVAHLHGGEKSGHIDGIIRHAITKLAHLHFAATHIASERIIKMGEERSRVITSGAPGLDSILKKNPSNKNLLLNKYHIDDRHPLIILIQHPVLSEASRAGKQMSITLQAILSLKVQTIVIYPNSDAGSKKMILEIEKYKNSPYLKIYKNIPHEDYLGLLKIATALVGNSSSGIIEAASFALPVINIGTRQNDRERSKNVISTGYSKKDIIDALKKIIIHDKLFVSSIKTIKNPYGNGNASKKIVKVLENIDIDKLTNKKLTY